VYGGLALGAWACSFGSGRMTPKAAVVSDTFEARALEKRKLLALCKL